MIETFEKKLNDLKSLLSEDQLLYIHPRSVENFFKYFKYLRAGAIRDEVIEYFNQYFLYIETRSFILTLDESDEVFNKYIGKIGTIYNSLLHFQVYMKPKWALFIAINIDLLLLILGQLKKIYYVPIATILFGGYIFYLKITYEKKGMLYGLRY
ncbi:MAG: hypothetical protein JWO92_117 [Chitinophagaceae bacterium]|nr:hypothetical protein [Chitinophagaceae bacterium]